MAPHQTRPGRWPFPLAVLLVLLLAASAAAQTPLPPPDAPPAPAAAGVAQSPAESSPSPDQPPASSVAPVAPAPPAPVAAATVADAPAGTAEDAAAAAAEHARALRAAAQRRRIRSNLTAIRDAALRGGQTLAGTRVASRGAAPAPAGAAAAPTTPAASAAPEPDGGPGQLLLLAVLGGTALVFAIAAYPALGRRGGTLERFRLEFAGVSVACVLVLLMVLAGVV